jgi:hypothetical protein
MIWLGKIISDDAGAVLRYRIGGSGTPPNSVNQLLNRAL